MKAAESKDRDTQYSVAKAYMQGQIVSADSVKGVDYFKRAAAQGHVEAQYSLGYIYTNGMGAARNLAEGAQWMILAQRGGHPQAAAAVESLRKIMASGDFDEADRLAQRRL
ncbi:tetratricopeptide repeat protein [Duganella sp. CT11-25]|uniref:tetratricopeptide repeat protein n=1 Tax=unclassified Duganella TaxID=2636909 RepID=UPI0039AED8E7